MCVVWWFIVHTSLKAKALRIQDCRRETLPQFRDIHIFRAEERIKARVTRRKAISVWSTSLNGETQLCKTLDRCSVASGCEEEETLLEFERKRVQDGPETENERVVRVVPAFVCCHTLERNKVQMRQSAHEELKLLRSEE